MPNRSLQARFFTLPGGVLAVGQVQGLSSPTDLTLYGLEGKTQSVKLEPNESGELSFRHRFEGVYSGQLALEGVDGLELDDKVYFSRDRYTQLRVSLLQLRQGAQRLKDMSYYLAKGFGVLQREFSLELEMPEPRSWATLGSSASDVIILNDLPLLGTQEAEALRDFARRGGRVLWVAGPSLLADHIDESVLAWLPASLKEIQRTDMALDLEGQLQRELFRFAPSSFRGRWLMGRLQPQAETLWRFEDGVPFWIKAKLGQGEVHLLSSPFHLAWSDALVQGDLPLLLQQILLQVQPKWKRQAARSELPFGESFPEDIVSYQRRLGPEPSPLRGELCSPGLYECDDQRGERVMLAANPPYDSEARQVLDAKQLRDEGASGARVGVMVRWDRWLALALALFLALEALLLFRRSRA
jgi:hypothetical protein